MSSRISPIDPATAQGHTKGLLDAVQSKLGMTPNLMRTMAQSPAVLEGYLSLNALLAKGTLPGAAREQLALAVGQANGCEYCVAAHSVLGKMAGLSLDQIRSARIGEAANPKAQAALTLARQIIDHRGDVTDAHISAARAAGLNDAELSEVVAHVALNILTNYFNRFARTEVDFPPVVLSL